MSDTKVTVRRLDGTEVTVTGPAADVLKRDLDRGVEFPGAKGAFEEAEVVEVPQEVDGPTELVIPEQEKTETKGTLQPAKKTTAKKASSSSTADKTA